LAADASTAAGTQVSASIGWPNARVGSMTIEAPRPSGHHITGTPTSS
jgi:hypothetical protein